MLISAAVDTDLDAMLLVKPPGSAVIEVVYKRRGSPTLSMTPLFNLLRQTADEPCFAKRVQATRKVLPRPMRKEVVETVRINEGATVGVPNDRAVIGGEVDRWKFVRDFESR